MSRGNAMQAQTKGIGIAQGPVTYDPSSSDRANDDAVERIVNRAIMDAIAAATDGVEWSQATVESTQITPYVVGTQAFVIAVATAIATGE